MKTFFLDFFDEYEPDEESARLLKGAVLDAVELSLRNRRVYIRILPDKLIHKPQLEKIRSGLQELYGDAEVIFQPKYQPEQLDSSYFPDLLYQAKRDISICNGFFENCACSLENETLTISLQNGGASLMEEYGCLKHIEKLVEEEFGRRITAVFDGVTELKEEVAADVQAAIRIARENAAAESQARPKRAERAEEGAPRSQGSRGTVKLDGDAPIQSVGEVVFGRPVRGSLIKLCDIRQDTGRAAVWGDVFNSTIKETRDGKRLICLISITDYTSSLYIKLFDEKAKLQPVLDTITQKGVTLTASGSVGYDKYERDIVLSADGIALTKRIQRMDNAAEKRVELHLHTNMSQMDGITETKKYIQRAAKWGHKAIAVTDHGVLQAFPDAASAVKKTENLKVLYGVEAYFVDDTVPAVYKATGSLKRDYVVFDTETTGLNPGVDALTEIGAVRIKDGEVVDSFNTFVNPGRPIPEKIVSLTGITDAMVQDAPAPGEAVRAFLEFCGQDVLVAHNAPFDMGFINAVATREGFPIPNGYIDTVPCARYLYPTLKNHKLNTLAQHVGAGDFNHHRACDDAAVLGKILLAMLAEFDREYQAKTLEDVNAAIASHVDTKRLKSYHQIILAKNDTGLKNLYKLVSTAHLDYYFKRPRVPKSKLMQMREGLIIGSACEAGELYRAVLENRPWEDLCKIADFYDYLEIQPVCNNRFLVAEGTLANDDAIRETNRKIVKLGEALHKPVVATCDVHFIDPEDEVFRHVILAGQGFSDADKPLPLYFRTTEEMLEEFSYLGEEKAYEVVVTNTNLIADQCEPIQPVPDGKFPPHMDHAAEDLRELCETKAKRLYGENLPEIVSTRMEKELNSIITHGYSVMYMIAQKLVAKSLSDGYLVGSRGSVGSSFAAFLSDITEVNSLCPHYLCDHCKNVEFFTKGEYEAGCDMPDKNCPVCGTPYRKEGFDIPFETFLGFEGDKEPDIDLNFSGEYQPNAHKYTEELFGEGYVFRAGTIGALADKTAYGYVKKYLDERGRVVNRAEEDRLVIGCTGIKRTTGQHPGGVVIVPKSNEVYDFCPIQHPADDPNSTIITTHFDYNCLHDTLLKLDILGHDDPTMIRMLEDLTGLNARTIRLDDPETMAIFTSNESLHIEPDDVITEVGSIAIPEFGTSFVRQMLVDTMPSTFAELVRISGLSHGTDVWLNNAQDLVRSGTANLKETICTRDDIMLYLIHKGVVPKLAFTIMESVRKGKGLKDEWVEAMRENNVPEWYIDSCKKIKYMFPKAHAVAYVTMAFRIAYFKVHYPLQFYAAYFTVRGDDFDAEQMIYGIDKVHTRLRELNAQQESTAKDKNLVTILEVCYEMYKRGFSFLPIDLYRSHYKNFIVTPEGLLPPLNSLQGVGENAAKAISDARENGPFISVDELAARSKVTKTVIETLDRNNVFKDLPKNSQVSLF